MEKRLRNSTETMPKKLLITKVRQQKVAIGVSYGEINFSRICSKNQRVNIFTYIVYYKVFFKISHHAFVIDFF